MSLALVSFAATAAPPPAPACRGDVPVLTTKTLLPDRLPFPLPPGTHAATAASSRNIPDTRLVVTRGGWVLDGEPVTALPPLDAVVAFVDPRLEAPEVAALTQALAASGAEVWVARSAAWSANRSRGSWEVPWDVRLNACPELGAVSGSDPIPCAARSDAGSGSRGGAACRPRPRRTSSTC